MQEMLYVQNYTVIRFEMQRMWDVFNLLVHFGL